MSEKMTLPPFEVTVLTTIGMWRSLRIVSQCKLEWSFPTIGFHRKFCPRCCEKIMDTRKKDTILRAKVKFIFIHKGQYTSIDIRHHLYSKGASTTPKAVILDFSTLTGSNLQILPAKMYHEHHRYFSPLNLHIKI